MLINVQTLGSILSALPSKRHGQRRYGNNPDEMDKAWYGHWWEGMNFRTCSPTFSTTSLFAPQPWSSPPRATPADLQAGSLLFLPLYDKRSSFIHLPQGFCRLPAHRRQCCFLDPRNYLHVGCIYLQLNGSVALRHLSPLNMLCARLLPASHCCRVGNAVAPLMGPCVREGAAGRAHKS